ncbi:MAG TPA: helicase associated domain-containing protein [Arthrobacter sp.]
MTTNAMPAELAALDTRRKQQRRPDPSHLDTWMERLGRVEAFVAATGDFPRSSHALPMSETLLYRWVLTQRRRGLSPAYRTILDERIPGWDDPVHLWDQAFALRVQELKIYRDAYGKWPSLRSTDPRVAALAGWVNNTRTAAKEGALAPDRQALLDSQVPGWNDTVEQTWQRTAREIAEFTARNGRKPSSGSGEHSERRLARWTDDRRRGRNMTPERDAFLDDVLPGWRIGMKGGRPRMAA